jgi:cupin 2 domain-containing protein
MLPESGRGFQSVPDQLKKAPHRGAFLCACGNPGHRSSQWLSLPPQQLPKNPAMQEITGTMKPDNIFADIQDNPEKEIFERLAGDGQVTIERIISRGQSSPATGWYDQDTNEWIIVLRGEARLSFEDQTSVHLCPGDYLNLPAHRKHRVDWTAPGRETIWLAVHYPN